MRPDRPLALLAALAAALGAAAAELDHGSLGDPHLSVVPRTEAEAERIAGALAPPTDFTAPEPFEARPGGAATSFAPVGPNAFSYASANISFERELLFTVGNGLFRKLWVTAPASTRASDGLGPVYNARSCQRCHLKDGRGHPPAGPEDGAVSIFLRVSIPAAPEDLPSHLAAIEGYLATAPEPTYGLQLQDFAIPGHSPEYRFDVAYEEFEVTLSEGEVAHLRRPAYRAADLGYGPLHPEAMLSPRVAPQMIGLGLLEAIPAADILAHADPDDADGDGISGRPNIVWSEEFGLPMLGRFGLKAGAPTVLSQSAGAFAGDIGISNPLHPGGSGECTVAQTHCLAAPDGSAPEDEGLEADAEVLDLVTFYSRNLAVPARRGLDDPEVLRGKRIFHETGCASCHVPKFVTHWLEDRPEQSFQLI